MAFSIRFVFFQIVESRKLRKMTVDSNRDDSVFKSGHSKIKADDPFMTMTQPRSAKAKVIQNLGISYVRYGKIQG